MKYLHRIVFFFAPLLLDDPLERDPGRELCLNESAERELRFAEPDERDPFDFADAEAFA